MKKLLLNKPLQYFAMVVVSVLFANWFFYQYTLQSPIVFRSPIKPKVYERVIYRVVTPTISPTKAPEPKKVSSADDVLKSAKNSDLLWHVYGLESTWGKNDGCRAQGKYNGFGYGQNTTSWNCFDTFEEVVTKVDDWFTKRLKENKNDITEALCYYNLGKPNLVNCNYYQNYLSI